MAGRRARWTLVRARCAEVAPGRPAARRNESDMTMEIAGRRLGVDAPLFGIAEIGLSHGGAQAEALRLVDVAAAAGVSAVKLQSLCGDTLVTASCPGPAHVAGESLREFFRQFELDEGAHAAVAARARAHGLAFMSTPFDESAVDMLERVGCDAYKIASGDITHHRLIERAALTGKPLVMSTGMSVSGRRARRGHRRAPRRRHGHRVAPLRVCLPGPGRQ